MTEQQPRLFQIWLDASDGSIATYDGIQWADGTADVHHRYRRPDGVQWTPEALAFQIHGKQARIEWEPDVAAELAEARMWARHGYEIGQRSNTWSDHGVAPTWLTENQPSTQPADGFRWHVLSECADEAACPIHGRNETPAVEGLEDGVDLPELTHEDALDLVDELGQQAYKAEDRLAFIAEMCELADRNGEAITTERVRSWLAYQGCGGAIVLPDDVQASLAESLGLAMNAMKPAAEPVFCHHPDARRTVHETMQAGWGRCSVVRLECPTCHEWAEQLNDEPVLAPKLLNAGRCTEACTEQHTARPGCLLAPDWGRKP